MLERKRTDGNGSPASQKVYDHDSFISILFFLTEIQVAN